MTRWYVVLDVEGDPDPERDQSSMADWVGLAMDPAIVDPTVYASLDDLLADRAARVGPFEPVGACHVCGQRYGKGRS